jgi:diguanylate cyclase
MSDSDGIPYDDDCEKAADRLRSTVSLLARHRIPVSPINYRIGYETVSGVHGQLQADFEELVNSQAEPDPASLWALYRKWFLQADESLDTLRLELKRVLADAHTQLQGADAGFSAYTDSLGRFAEKLDSPALQAETLAGDVSCLIDETRQFQDVQRQAHRHMGGLMQEVEILRRELSQAREEAMTDALTQIANRKAFDGELSRLVEQAGATGTPLVLMMIDIDHFKQFNDTHGHIVGDRVLRFVASTIKNTLGDSGVVSRYGGEEFAALLPGIDEAQVSALADKLLRTVCRGDLRDRKANKTYGRITVSIGIAGFRSDDDGRTLVERADKALYRAKESGRNCARKAA